MDSFLKYARFSTAGAILGIAAAGSAFLVAGLETTVTTDAVAALVGAAGGIIAVVKSIV